MDASGMVRTARSWKNVPEQKSSAVNADIGREAHAKSPRPQDPPPSSQSPYYPFHRYSSIIEKKKKKKNPYIENSVDISIHRNLFLSIEIFYYFLYIEIFFPDLKKKILQINKNFYI